MARWREVGVCGIILSLVPIIAPWGAAVLFRETH